MRVRLYVRLYSMWWHTAPSNPRADNLCLCMNNRWSRMTPEERALARSLETR
jgi:hypothetical protein